MNTSPLFGTVVALTSALAGVECWNFTDQSRHTLPAGTLIQIERAYDATHFNVTVINDEGETIGLPLAEAEGFERTGYRFIVPNRKLAEATGLPVPVKSIDLVGELIAYEEGSASPRETKSLFRHLKASGIGAKLQGHYSSAMG